MVKTGLLIVCLIFILTGCATTGAHQSQTQLLERQVSDLDSRIKENDREIAGLKGELKSLRSDMNGDKRKMVIDDYVPVSKSYSDEMTDKQVQQALKNAGYYSGTVDGKIGTKTTEAIKKFQKANGLKADGVAGAMTQTKLKRYLKGR